MRGLYYVNAALWICFNFLFGCFSCFKWEQNVRLQHREPWNRPVLFPLSITAMNKQKQRDIHLDCCCFFDSSCHDWLSQRSSSSTIYTVVVSTVAYLRKSPIIRLLVETVNSGRTSVGRALELLTIKLANPLGILCASLSKNEGKQSNPILNAALLFSTCLLGPLCWFSAH